MKVKVRLLMDTYDGKKGDVFDLDRHTAFAWVRSEVAEFYMPPEQKAKAAPKNKAKPAPKTKAKGE